MNKTLRLSESGIEYLDYAWSFYSGCLNWKNGICPVENCWAKAITERFGNNYPNGFDPTFYPEAFLSPLRLKKPSIIGCAFMGDLFGDWVDPFQVVYHTLPGGATTLKGAIFRTIEACPQHTFLFKTKCPWNLPQWNPFPPNCSVGVTVCNDAMMTIALTNLANVEAKVRYLSIEPHLGFISMKSHPIKGIVDWIIDGAQTKPYKPPEIFWVEEIVRAADQAGIPVFLKENLMPLFDFPVYSLFRKKFPAGRLELRQEMLGVVLGESGLSGVSRPALVGPGK